MKGIIFFILMIQAELLFGQGITRNPMIENFQSATISLGIIDSTATVDNTGKVDTINKLPFYKIIGTGIICYINTLSGPLLTVVTAKHVLMEDTSVISKLRFRLPQDDNLPVDRFFGHPIHLKFKNGGSALFSLPDNDVDLICFAFLSSDTSVRSKNYLQIPYNLFADSSSYVEGTEVFVLGYPGAVEGNYWTRALVRKGIIAWVPSSNIEQRKFLIDCNIFPGNSGGPVFRNPPAIFYGDTTLSAQMQQQSLLGIVVQRRFSNNKVYEANKTGRRPVFSAGGNMIISEESIGVGVVEPAYNVLRLLREYEKYVNGK